MTFSWIWKPVDAFADWLRHRFGVQAQLRMGVLMVGVGVGYLLVAPFTSEPRGVYVMSALALMGVGVVVSAETLREVVQGNGGK
jgi:F0F1-type ATP synthase assembly protein I